MSGAAPSRRAGARVPDAWCNAVPLLPAPLEPSLHPLTRRPVAPGDLTPVLAAALVAQETATDAWIDVPGPVLDVLAQWRPTPLVRARRLEAALATPAHIYYKDESRSPPGSHRATTAVAQVFYSRQEGVARLVTGSSSGRWGSALAFACAEAGVACTVYRARASVAGDPRWRAAVEQWSGAVAPSPTAEPSRAGSMATAVADAVGDALARPDTRYAFGSVMNHVLLHQTSVGLEAREQLALAGEERPDVVVGECGGGHVVGGIALPFLADRRVRLVAVESSARPVLTGGRFSRERILPPPATAVADAAGAGGVGPLVATYSLGPDFVGPSGSGGHGPHPVVAPLVANLVRAGRMEAVAYRGEAVLEAAAQWARSEGPIAGLGTAHAVRAAIDEALLAREEGRKRVILLSFTGTAADDLTAYAGSARRAPG